MHVEFLKKNSYIFIDSDKVCDRIIINHYRDEHKNDALNYLCFKKGGNITTHKEELTEEEEPFVSRGPYELKDNRNETFEVVDLTYPEQRVEIIIESTLEIIPFYKSTAFEILPIFREDLITGFQIIKKKSLRGR